MASILSRPQCDNLVKMPLPFVCEGPIYNDSTLVQATSCRWSADKPSAEPTMALFLIVTSRILIHYRLDMCVLFIKKLKSRQFWHTFKQAVPMKRNFYLADPLLPREIN